MNIMDATLLSGINPKESEESMSIEDFWQAVYVAALHASIIDPREAADAAAENFLERFSD